MRTACYQVGVVSAPITIIAARYTEGEEKEEPAYLASLSFDIPIHRRPLLLLVVRMLPRRRQRLLLIRTGRSRLDDVCEERSESCSGADDTLPLTKHVDSSEDDVDKACLSDSRVVPVSADSVVQLAEDGVEIHSIGDAEWSGFRPTDPRIADVREISPQSEGSSSLDITVVDPTGDAHQLGVNTHQP
ncbi:hypothetical protein BHE74_00022197 [Ensete ventricosum]|nr:hypothetical protein BHE74_00022197 [Ensete ventricosum]